jgi:hypothetical protein
MLSRQSRVALLSAALFAVLFVLSIVVAEAIG